MYWVVLYEGVIYGYLNEDMEGTDLNKNCEFMIPVQQLKKIIQKTDDSLSFTMFVLYDDTQCFKVTSDFLGEGVDIKNGLYFEIEFLASSINEANSWLTDLSSIAKGLIVQNSATKTLSSISSKVMSSWRNIVSKPSQ